MRATVRSRVREANGGSQPAPGAEPEPGVAGLRARLEAAFAPIRAEDLRRIAAEVERAVGEVSALRDQLAALAALKASLAAAG
jgi:hypothetical protein